MKPRTLTTRQHSAQKTTAIKTRIDSEFKASINKDLATKTAQKPGRNRTDMKTNFGLHGESTYGERSLS